MPLDLSTALLWPRPKTKKTHPKVKRPYLVIHSRVDTAKYFDK